jgi:hypothetical protein
MSQAPASTDELLSQLASSEIDRLLAEAENGTAAKQSLTPPPVAEAPKPAVRETPAETPAPAPAAEPPVADPQVAEPLVAAPPAAAAAEASERSALLEAAGFEANKPEAAPPPPETQSERSAILEAAGFESIEETAAASAIAAKVAEGEDSDYVPIYLKPLVWINSPLESYPSVLRKMLGSAGIVTLLNALAVLTYVFFFRKH